MFNQYMKPLKKLIREIVLASITIEKEGRRGIVSQLIKRRKFPLSES